MSLIAPTSPRLGAAWRAFGPGAALAVVVVVVYLAALQGGFLWDDDSHVTANPCIVGPLGLKEIWTTAAANYFPLVLTNFWLQHALWGLNPLGYHAVTLGCHALAAVVLWRVLRRLRVPGAWLGATLWALHPVQVESVAWISELKNTQSAVFFLLAIYFFVRWREWQRLPAAEFGKTAAAPRQARGAESLDRLGTLSSSNGLVERGSRSHYIIALVCALLALLSKPSTVMLPVALGLCAWWQCGQLRWRDARALVPFFAISALASGWAIWEQTVHSGALGVEWRQTFSERFAIAGRAIWFYLGKLAWPQPLSFIYARWEIDPARLLVYLPLAAALVGVFVLWCFRRGRLRPVFFAAAYFGALLLPVLGFFNVYFFRYSFVSDHFQYLASIGPLALAGAVVVQAGRRSANTISGLILFALSVLTWRQSTNFSDHETLWRATLARNPSAGMAWLNLGATLAKQHRDKEAIACFQRAARVRPADAAACNDAGWGLIASGYPAAAVPLLERALQLNPDQAEAHNNLGNALRQLGRSGEATTHYARALELKPGSAEAHNNLGSILAQTGRLAEAIAQFETALRLAPTFAPAHANLGAALGLAARWPEAIVQLEAALRLKPDYPDAHGQLAVALVNAGRPNDAVPHFEAELRLNPAAVAVHRNFGQVLQVLGRNREAAEHLERAAQLERGR